MPIIDDLNLSPNTRVVIWEINESLQDLESKVVLSEYSLKLLNQKKSEIQKKQFLAIRNIFKLLSIEDKEVKYDKAGKPPQVVRDEILLATQDARNNLDLPHVLFINK